MKELKEAGLPDDIIEFTQDFWEYSSTLQVSLDDELARNLTADEESAALGVFRLKSRKLTNVIFNWKALMLDIFPLGVGVVATAYSNPQVGILLGLRAIYLASGLSKVVLDKDSSAIVVKLHELSWSPENNEYNFFPIKRLEEVCSDIAGFNDKLASLFELGIAALDQRGVEVIMYEKVLLAD